MARLYIEEIIKLNTANVAAAAKERVKTTLRKLTIDKNFSPNQFWELCKKYKNNQPSCTSVVANDGRELFGEDLIANAYLEEFVHRLRKREIIPELKNYEMRTEQIFGLCFQKYF